MRKGQTTNRERTTLVTAEPLTARLAAAGAMLPQLYTAADAIADSPTPERLHDAIAHAYRLDLDAAIAALYRAEIAVISEEPAAEATQEEP